MFKSKILVALKQELERVASRVNNDAIIVSQRSNLVLLLHVCSKSSLLLELLVANLAFMDVSTFFQMRFEVFKFCCDRRS